MFIENSSSVNKGVKCEGSLVFGGRVGWGVDRGVGDVVDRFDNGGVDSYVGAEFISGDDR